MVQGFPVQSAASLGLQHLGIRFSGCWIQSPSYLGSPSPCNSGICCRLVYFILLSYRQFRNAVSLDLGILASPDIESSASISAKTACFGSPEGLSR